jgi:Domain of unknown function (DUF4411)
LSYLLDANVFIQAKNLHYGFDFCPAFWHWILANAGTGQVRSIDKVADELTAGNDDLSVWASTDARMLFHATDAAVAARFGQVAAWVNRQGYEPAAVSTFFQVADFYLVAHGLAGGHTIVTHEVSGNSMRKIKIPNV